MKKLVCIFSLVCGFALTAGADFEASHGVYTCHAKDYENLWFSGHSSESAEEARESAIRNCRQGSQAPETCQVQVCEAR